MGADKTRLLAMLDSLIAELDAQNVQVKIGLKRFKLADLLNAGYGEIEQAIVKAEPEQLNALLRRMQAGLDYVLGYSDSL
jgi:hypothetical protein